ncbi:MAG TPA: hypothetical protein V6D50_03895 [Chroococcales cyanobacterium]|jgi:hypothetical protein
MYAIANTLPDDPSEVTLLNGEAFLNGRLPTQRYTLFVGYTSSNVSVPKPKSTFH